MIIQILVPGPSMASLEPFNPHPSVPTLPRILCVGLACLDIVNHCDHYPEEDTDIRSEDQKWCSGGNAMNTSKVLALIGHHCELVGTLGGGMETE